MGFVSALLYTPVGPSRWCLVAAISLESEGNEYKGLFYSQVVI
jgi:hypothetical protein